MVKQIPGKVPNKFLEEKLNELVQLNQIEIRKGVEINNLQDIYNQVLKDKIICIIGADGRRSKVRTDILPFLTK